MSYSHPLCQRHNRFFVCSLLFRASDDRKTMVQDRTPAVNRTMGGMTSTEQRTGDSFERDDFGKWVLCCYRELSCWRAKVGRSLRPLARKALWDELAASRNCTHRLSALLVIYIYLVAIAFISRPRPYSVS